MSTHPNLIIASLPTTHGRVRVGARWERRSASYAIRLDGTAAALRALLPEAQAPAHLTTRSITIRPPQPIADLAAVEPFYEAVAQRWRVVRNGAFSAFVPGVPPSAT